MKSDDENMTRMKAVAKMPREADPLTPWDLTTNDKRFLRRNRITTDEPEIADDDSEAIE